MTAIIGLVGDRDPTKTAHQAIPQALHLAADELGVDLADRWIATASIDPAAPALGDLAGLWCVPGSPYRSTEGALAAIRFARETGVPFLGTCGGFQHALLEIAKALWGVESVAHAELDATAATPVITPLACSLVEKRGGLRFAPTSRLAAAYGSLQAVEGYHCSYGFNPDFAGHLETGPLRASAWDDAGDLRGVELESHPFFVATLFQPERAALEGRVPPIVGAFVRAVTDRSATECGASRPRIASPSSLYDATPPK